MDIRRYMRQVNLIGKSGQDALSKSCVSIMGCGSLGSTVAENLARMGIGKLKLIDNDGVEDFNISVSSVFNESDVGRSKTDVLKKKLSEINSSCEIEAIKERITESNIKKIKADVIIDCTDNMETRYMINKFCLKEKIPWVYGGVISFDGMVSSFNPKQGTPCFRCLFPSEVKTKSLPTTCEEGVMLPIVSIIASLQTMEAVSILTGSGEPSYGKLLTLNRKTVNESGFTRNIKCADCSK